MRTTIAVLEMAAVLFFCVAEAPGAPVSGHPRIFLDASRLQFIRNKVASGDPSWTRFRDYMDWYYTADGYNLVQGALMYQALKTSDPAKADRYATQVVKALMDVIRQGVPAAEDVIKYYLPNIGLAYDWCYDKTTSQQKTDIINWVNKVYQNNPTSHHYDTKIYLLHWWNNYNAAYMYGNAVVGYAIYDENPTLAQDMIDNANHRFSTDMLGQMSLVSSNGAYVEGDGYGYHVGYMLFYYLKAVETAEQVNLWDDFPWISNRMTYDMFAFFPTKYLDPDYGHYKQRMGTGDSPRHSSMGDLVRAGALMYISSFPDAAESQRMQYWLDEIGKKTLSTDTCYEDFLWYNPAQTSIPYSSAPLATFSGEGTAGIALGEVLMRSDWTEKATWIRFSSGDYFSYHQHLESNHFNIFKYEDLATESGAYEGAGGTTHFGNYLKRSIAHNTVLVYAPGLDSEWYHSPMDWDTRGANDGGDRGIDIVNSRNKVVESRSWATTGYNHGDYPVVGYQKYYDRAQIRRFEDTSKYAYVLGDAAKARSSWRSNRFDREFVFIRPARTGGKDFVVIYDRVNAGRSTFEKYWIMHSNTLPSVSGKETAVEKGISDFDGDRVTITNKKGRLFLKSLLPTSRKITRIGGLAEGKDSWVFGTNYPSEETWAAYGTYRIQIQPTVSRLSDAFLNVLFPTSSKTKSMPETILVTSSTQNMTGAHIKDAAMNFVVMFSAATNGADVTGRITYAINPTAITRHILLNLPPNKSFTVTVAKDGRTITITPGSGRYLSTAQGVLTFDISGTSIE
jgi:hypothetical protein